MACSVTEDQKPEKQQLTDFRKQEEALMVPGKASSPTALSLFSDRTHYKMISPSVVRNWRGGSAGIPLWAWNAGWKNACENELLISAAEIDK